MTQPLVKPTEVELLNPSASFRQAKDGNRYRVSFEVAREVWELFETPSPGQRLRGLLWIADDDEGDREVMQTAIEKPTKRKPKEPLGPYGKYWEGMVKQTIFNRPDLWQALDVDGPTRAAEALRETFNVTSRTFIAPAEFEAWCDKNNLQAIITISRGIIWQPPEVTS